MTGVAVIALFLSGAGNAVQQDPSVVVRQDDRPEPSVGWRDGFLLVRFKPGISAASAAQLHKAVAAERVREFPALDLHLVKLPHGLGVEEAIERYRVDPRVAYAEPDYRVSVDTTPSDPRFTELWGLHNTGQSGGVVDADIDATEAWDVSVGHSGVVVAVIDTGIDPTHPDLQANLWVNPGEIPANGIDDDSNGYVDDVYGINTILHNGNPTDDHGHGTHVAGTIGATGNNGLGVVGVNWSVRILSCKFLNAGGNGNTSDAVECLQYIKQMRDGGVAIVASNNSWGSSSYSQALVDAIDAQREILCVAAAGNDHRNTDYTPHYPASHELPSVVAVAASGKSDTLAGFSNFGKGTVHIAAPGDLILSTLPVAMGSYGYRNGTSMATPHVTGVAALLKATDPSRDWRAIRSLLLSGGDPLAALDPTTITGRRLNAFGAVSCVARRLVQPMRPPTTATVGNPVTLRVLSITCPSSTGPVSVTTSQGETFDLLDDGVPPDAAAGDGVFTGTWTPLRSPERLDVSSPAGATTIRVPPRYIEHYVPDANTRVPYSQHLAVTDAIAPTAWTIVSGGLPPGLELNGMTGGISGQPTATGTYPFTVQLSDAWGPDMTREMSIRVQDGDIGEDFARSLHEGGGSEGRGIATDASGNVFVVGSLGNLTGQSGYDYLAKYAPSGAIVWLKRNIAGRLYRIAVDEAGAIYASGHNNSDGLLVKFDASGEVLWSRTYNRGTTPDIAYAVAVGPGGDVFVVGNGNTAGVESYIQRVDPSGNLLWFRTYSNGVSDYGRGVAADRLGNSYLGGHTATAVPNGSGGYFYHYDAIVQKYDPAGNLVWSRTYDTGSRYDFHAGLALAGDDEVYALVRPEEENYSDFVTLKYNGAGDLEWVRPYGSETAQLATALAVDRQGGVYATGWSHNEAGGDDWDFLTVKYDPSGNLVWDTNTDARYRGSITDGDFPAGVAVDTSGRVSVTGRSFNGVDGYDALLVRYSAIGSPGEASSEQDMTAQRGPGVEEVSVDYDAGCGATDHAIAWGTGPISGGATWIAMACSLGNSGSASFDPGEVASGTFVYFVVVSQDDETEGSYGRDSVGVERSEAVGLGACDKPLELGACSSP